MDISSNLYATSVFAEHPISLYPLDDDVSYISLITSQQRQIKNWTDTYNNWSPGNTVQISNAVGNGTSVTYTTSSNHLFVSGQEVRISGITPSGYNVTGIITVTAANTFTIDSDFTGTYSSGGIATNVFSPNINSPFDDLNYEAIFGNVPSANGEVIEWVSQDLFNAKDLNTDMSTFSVSFYLYQNSNFINWYEVGYIYLGQEYVTRVEAQEGSAWINFDFTYYLEQFANTNIKLIARVNVDLTRGTQTGGESDYRFLINGLTVGQWAETTSSESFGVFPSSAPLGYTGVPASEYGILQEPAYYLVEENRLLAKNEGLPLIYGSKNSTKIIPAYTIGKPSMIIPGNGFLHESGRFNDYTVEFWLKLNPNTDISRKIFGPVDSDDGIYINNGFISLVVDNKFASHPVSEWYRTMLVHVVVSDTEAYLLINGEKVASISINKQLISLPSGNNWVAFYSYSDIELFQIDCVSFYTYPIPTAVAKRRFVYGEGTDSPQFLSSFFDGTTSYVNFSNAQYTTNKIYPDTGNWQTGYTNNMLATRSSISVPQYALPEIVVQGRSVDDLYLNNQLLNEISFGETFFSLRPHEEVLIVDGGTATTVTFDETITGGDVFQEITSIVAGGTAEGNDIAASGVARWDEDGYLLFDSLGFVDGVYSFYGIFGASDTLSYAPLFVIKNSNSSDEFSIVLEDDSVKYYFNDELLGFKHITEETFDGYYYVEPASLDEKRFVAGINIKKFSQVFGYNIYNFFQTPENLQVYVAGNTINTFTEKIYRVAFSNKDNYDEIAESFDENGIVVATETQLLDHFASYTLKPYRRFNTFFLDIAVSSRWEEYFPLSTFAGYTTNIDGDFYYDLDMLQVNLGYPSVTEIIREPIDDVRWTYAELFLEWSTPITRSYAILNNPELSGYYIYEDLNFKEVFEFFFDTDKSSLRSYITFQFLADGANKPLADFQTIRKPYASRVIDAEADNTVVEPYRAYQTVYEFVDKSVVFPPKSVDFQNIAMVVYLQVKEDGILSRPLRVRQLEIASRSLSQYDFNPIGTESGVPLYPYVKTGIYYNNKENNPHIISKKRYPYLYLTKDSGVGILGTPDPTREHSVAMPINEKAVGDFRVGAFQFWMKYELTEFPIDATPIFEIEYLDKTIEFVIRTDASNKRGVIVPRNKATKALESGMMFYQNGSRVKSIILERDDWNCVGIEFDTPISFNFTPGYITFFRGITFNNVSYYKPSGLGETLSTETRTWAKVLSDDDINNLTWATWYVDETVETGQRTNLAYNPSIEVDTTGWVASGGGITFQRTSADSLFGDHSLRCTVSAFNNSGMIFGFLTGTRIPIDPNKEYTASAYVKIPEGFPDKELRIRIRQFTQVNAGSALPIENGPAITITDENGWLRVFATFTSNNLARACAIEISQNLGNVNGSTFLIDGVMLEETATLVPKVNTYFDGGITAGGLLTQSLQWNGTPNNSSSTVVYYIQTGGTGNLRQWIDIYVLNQKLESIITPKDIYNLYAGTNNFVVDSESTVTIDSDSLVAINSASWNRISALPA